MGEKAKKTVVIHLLDGKIIKLSYADHLRLDEFMMFVDLDNDYLIIRASEVKYFLICKDEEG